MVTDGTTASYTGAGFRNLTGSTGSYTYDGNGNLTSDPYKGFFAITHNAINRTEKIYFSSPSNRSIDYSYNVDGTLLRKRQYDNIGGVVTLQATTDYIDGFVYLNGTLQYFGMPEGRVLNNGGTLSREYTIADQQGNVRVTFDNTGAGGTAKVRQENSYYAFGLIIPGSTVATPTNDNKNLYNGGSEWQNDFGNLPDYYQTFYRNYDAALARWTGVDPKAESAESMTGYQYAGNSPVMGNDPMGDLYKVPTGDLPSPPSEFANESGDNGGGGGPGSSFGGGDGGGWNSTGFGGIPSMGPMGAVIYDINQGIGTLGNAVAAINYFTGQGVGSAQNDAVARAAASMALAAGGNPGSTMLPEVKVNSFWTGNLPSWWGNGQQFINSNSANLWGTGLDNGRGIFGSYIPGGGTYTPDLTDLVSEANAVMAAVAPFAKSTIGYMRSGSYGIGRYYSGGWGGGSRALIKTVKFAKVLGFLGFAVGETLDIIGLANNKITWAKAGVNFAMGIVGFTEAAPVSIVYLA